MHSKLDEKKHLEGKFFAKVDNEIFFKECLE